MRLEEAEAQDVSGKGKFDDFRRTAVPSSLNRNAARLYEKKVGFDFASAEENFVAREMAKGEPLGEGGTQRI
jgi:hypothetical protein